MRDILFLTWPGHAEGRKALAGVAVWHEAQGHRCRHAHMKIKPEDFGQSWGEPDLVYMWNGEDPSQADYRRYFDDRRIPMKFVEMGWFPQHRYIYVDDRGTNGNCSLFRSHLEWLDGRHYSAVMERREELFGDRMWVGLDRGQYTAVPLQLQGDTQIRVFSPDHKDTEGFMDFCEATYTDIEVRFRRHPKEYMYLDDRARPPEGDLYEWLRHSKRVVGINSTVLLEAALLGCPVYAHGICLLDIDPDPARSLAALVAKQIPIGETGLDPWAAHPGLGLQLNFG